MGVAMTGAIVDKIKNVLDEFEDLIEKDDDEFQSIYINQN